MPTETNSEEIRGKILHMRNEGYSDQEILDSLKFKKKKLPLYKRIIYKILRYINRKL